MFAVSVKAYERRSHERRVATVRLNDGDLVLVREITHLGGLDHRGISPAGDHIGLDIPLDGSLGRTGGYIGTDDEPAVGVVHTAVI